MTISEKEVIEDFQRFIRHEAMRANCSQYHIMEILNLPISLENLKNSR